ncbi:MAG: YHYH protein [Acidobacteriota bacterium]
MSTKRLSPLVLVCLTVLSSALHAQTCPDRYIVQPDTDPANGRYPDPNVTASCSGSTMTVTSNGIPGFAFQQITPNRLRAQSFRWTIPVAPALPANASDIPLLGTIAFSVNGLPIYGPNEGAQPADEAFGDPIFNGIMDFCLGHTGPRAEYHLHAVLTECVDSVTPAGEASPILGFALDGFPIYGPSGCLDESCTEVVEFQSSWVQVGDPTSQAWDNYEYVENENEAFLDECNGRIGPDGTYRYHATATFPYVLGCYAGEDILKSDASQNGGEKASTSTFSL